MRTTREKGREGGKKIAFLFFIKKKDFTPISSSQMDPDQPHTDLRPAMDRKRDDLSGREIHHPLMFSAGNRPDEPEHPKLPNHLVKPFRSQFRHIESEYLVG